MPHSTTVPRFYVYALARPDGTPFYIGKGTGRRMYAHEAEARRRCPCERCKVIREIWKDRQDLQYQVLFRTDDEDEAFAYEYATIARYGRASLTNCSDGGRGPYNWTRSYRPSPKDIEPHEKRKSGSGSIFRRKDGRWVARIEFDHSTPNTLKKNRKTRTLYGNSRAEVTKRLEEFQEELAKEIEECYAKDLQLLKRFKKLSSK